MVIIAQIGGSLSCSLGPRLSLASSPDLDMCEQSPHSLRGLVRPERLPGGVAPQGPRPSQPGRTPREPERDPPLTSRVHQPRLVPPCCFLLRLGVHPEHESRAGGREHPGALCLPPVHPASQGLPHSGACIL